MRLFVIEHAPEGDIYRQYEGMSKEVVGEIVSASGNAYEFVSEAVYAAKILILQAPISGT